LIKIDDNATAVISRLSIAMPLHISLFLFLKYNIAKCLPVSPFLSVDSDSFPFLSFYFVGFPFLSFPFLFLSFVLFYFISFPFLFSSLLFCSFGRSEVIQIIFVPICLNYT
jgi:hypothetical protein